MHESLPCEFFHAFDVDRAPYAMRLSRCETDAVAHVVDPPANAVDPTIAECAVDSLGQIFEERTPTHKSGKRVKVFYETQIDVAPPTIALIVNNPSLVDDNYQRFIGTR